MYNRIPRIEIHCTSTAGGRTRHKAVFPTLARALTSNKLAQEGFRNSAGKVCATKLIQRHISVNEIQELWNIM
jgi:hypothetical protein